MERKVLVILYKKDRFYQHLDYVLNEKIFIQITKNNFNISYLKDYKIKERLSNKSFNGYKMIGCKEVIVNIETQYEFMKLHFYNCISLGKILLGMRGIFFSCESFFNKIKG